MAALEFVCHARPEPLQPAPDERGFAPGVDLAAVVAPFARNEEIYAEEDETKYVYKVVSGAVRATRILSDGRRHVSAFHLAGEIFGFEPGPKHRFAADRSPSKNWADGDGSVNFRRPAAATLHPPLETLSCSF